MGIFHSGVFCGGLGRRLFCFLRNLGKIAPLVRQEYPNTIVKDLRLKVVLGQIGPQFRQKRDVTYLSDKGTVTHQFGIHHPSDQATRIIDENGRAPIIDLTNKVIEPIFGEVTVDEKGYPITVGNGIDTIGHGI